MSVTRQDVIARMSNPGACTVDAIADALTRLDHDEAAVRLIARAVTGFDIPPSLIAATLPYMRETTAAIAVIRVCEGDRAETLLGLLKSNAFQDDQNGAVLRLLAIAAIVMVGSAAQKQRAAIAARLFVIRCLYDGKLIPLIDGVISLADQLNDAYLTRMLAPFTAVAAEDVRTREPLNFALLRRALDEPIEKLGGFLLEGSPLVEKLNAPPPPLTKLFHAGRNEPCPCGSGKKFKRCHAQTITKELRRGPMPSEYEEVRDTTLNELVIRGPRRLAGPVLADAIERLIKARAWEVAGKFLDDLAGRADVRPGLSKTIASS